jgi:hypothetical protein
MSGEFFWIVFSAGQDGPDGDERYPEEVNQAEILFPVRNPRC